MTTYVDPEPGQGAQPEAKLILAGGARCHSLGRTESYAQDTSETVLRGCAESRHDQHFQSEVVCVALWLYSTSSLNLTSVPPNMSSELNVQ